jgi:hypothetical protein
MGRVKHFRRPPLVFAAALMVALAIAGGTALAGHLSGDVKSYTGCLTLSGGTMSQIKEGDAPLRTCPSGSVQVHVSGGDITEIAAGTGVQVMNGENGEATIGLDAKYSLPQSCSSDDFAKWNGSGWVCGRYSKGTGLALNGTEFSIAPEFQVKNDQACASGQFAKGITSTGALDCAALPPPPSKQGYFKHLPTAPVFKLAFRTAISLSLPAGKYIVTATATAHDDDDNETTVECRLNQGATSLGGSEVWVDDVVDAGSPDNTGKGSIAITAATTLSAAGTVELSCASTRGNDSLSDPAITAVEVDGVNVQ